MQTYVNQQVAVELTGADNDGDPLTFKIVTPPTHGVIVGTPPQVTYIPALDYIGPDQFGFVANDGKDNSKEAKVTINVLAGSADDRDGDGVANAEDAFPDDPAEIYDSNGDGKGNFAEQDEDGDGTPDEEDGFPFDATRQVLPQTVEVEFNDNPADATVVSAPIPFAVSGAIQVDIDGDFYRFQGESGQSITALLKKTASGFKPSLTIVDANGNVLPAAELKLGAAGTNVLSVSVTLPATGNYFLSVTDFRSKGAAEFTYAITVFHDADLDGLDDDVARALGVNAEKADSDDDGLVDLVESLLVIDEGFDVDGDHLPNWLDRDSDGDTIADAAETADDVDGDGLPNFLDPDADGNGINDIVEKGTGSDPVDSDKDGRSDYVDLDDDNDGLPDSIDNDRLVALLFTDELDESRRLIVNHMEYQVNDKRTIDVAPVSESVVLYGSGFAINPTDNRVLFKSGDNYVSVTPDFATTGSLTFTVPYSGSSSLFVVAGDRRSNAIEIQVLDASAPLLFSQELTTVLTGQTLTLFGEHFVAPMVVNIGGVAADAFDVSATQASVVVPAGVTTGQLWIATAAGTSNAVPLSIQSSLSLHVTLPTGSTVQNTELSVSAGLVDDAVVDANGDATFNVSVNDTDVVSVFYNDDQGETLVMQAMTWPGLTALDVNATSTAMAAVVLASPVLSQLQPTQLETIWPQLQALSEMTALRDMIADGLAGDPKFLLSPGVDYLRGLNAAVVASESLAQSAFASAQAASLKLSGPTITPEQHDIKVFAKQRGTFDPVFTGDIGVENDSQMYLSTQFVDRETGAELYPHIGSFFDVNMVGPQRAGALFLASVKDDYGQCGFIDCDVYIITGGASPVASDKNIAQILAAKAIIERIAYPIFEYALGLEINPGVVTKILVNAAPTVVNAVGAQAANGSPEDAAKALVVYLYDDMRSPPNGGPVTQAFVAYFGKALTQELKEKLAKRMAAKAIPVLGQISTALEVIGAAGTGWGVSKAVYDILSTPGDLHYEVQWPMEVVDILPRAVSLDDGPINLILKGQGLGKVERVRLVDQGPGGQPPLVLDPGVMTEDQRGLSVLIPGDYIAEAVGPIDVSISGPNSAYDTSPVQLEVVADLTIVQLIENKGVVGDVVDIRGAGFHPVRFYNEVTFQGKNGRITATVLDATRHLIRTRVPVGAITGDATVQVNDEISNPMLYEVESGNVVIDFGDNGSANDDTFGLYVDSRLIHAMPAPTRSAGPFSLQLTPGLHNVMLRGITAPDEVGTYFISFSGDILSLTGDPATGSDLTAGVEKHWTLDVGSGALVSAQSTVVRTANTQPTAGAWQE